MLKLTSWLLIILMGQQFTIYSNVCNLLVNEYDFISVWFSTEDIKMHKNTCSFRSSVYKKFWPQRFAAVVQRVSLLNAEVGPFGSVCSLPSVCLTSSWFRMLRQSYGRWKILTLCSYSVLHRDYSCKSNISLCIAVRFGSVLDDLLLGMWQGSQVILSEYESLYLLYLSVWFWRDSLQWVLHSEGWSHLYLPPPPPLSLFSPHFLLSPSLSFELYPALCLGSSEDRGERELGWKSERRRWSDRDRWRRERILWE